MIATNRFTGLGGVQGDWTQGIAKASTHRVQSNRTVVSFEGRNINFAQCYTRLQAALKDPEIRGALDGVKVSDGPHGKLIHIDNVAFLQQNGVLQADKEGEWTPAQVKEATRQIKELDASLHLLEQLRSRPELFQEQAGKAMIERTAEGGFEMFVIATAATAKELAVEVAQFAEAVTSR